jgi:hypothetical protein
MNKIDRDREEDGDWKGKELLYTESVSVKYYTVSMRRCEHAAIKNLQICFCSPCFPVFTRDTKERGNIDFLGQMTCTHFACYHFRAQKSLDFSWPTGPSNGFVCMKIPRHINNRYSSSYFLQIFALLCFELLALETPRSDWTNGLQVEG